MSNLKLLGSKRKREEKETNINKKVNLGRFPFYVDDGFFVFPLRIQLLRKKLESHDIKYIIDNENDNVVVLVCTLEYDSLADNDVLGELITMPSENRDSFPMKAKLFVEHDSYVGWERFEGADEFIDPFIGHTMSKMMFGNDVVIYNDNHLEVGGISYIESKQENEFIREVRNTLVSFGDDEVSRNLMFTRGFLEQIKQQRTGILYTFMTHEISLEIRHSNAIIIDWDKRTLTRFEPHGAYSTYYSCIDVDNHLTMMMQRVPELSGLTYISQSDYGRMDGPQTVESCKQTLFKKQGGFCLAWAAYFIFLHAKNRDMDLVEFYYTVFDRSPNELACQIRLFQAWLVMLNKGIM